MCGVDLCGVERQRSAAADPLVGDEADVTDEVLVARHPARVGRLVPVARGAAAADVDVVGLVHVTLAEGGLPRLPGDPGPGSPSVVGVVRRVDPDTDDRVGRGVRVARDRAAHGRAGRSCEVHARCHGQRQRCRRNRGSCTKPSVHPNSRNREPQPFAVRFAMLTHKV